MGRRVAPRFRRVARGVHRRHLRLDQFAPCQMGKGDDQSLLEPPGGFREGGAARLPPDA